MAVPVATTPAFSAGTPQLLFEGPFRMDGPFRAYDVTPDGQRFLMVREVPRPQAGYRRWCWCRTGWRN